uniref:Small ribosomal subunit protein mS40 n=1 Tax=Serinus canaria TaxID=9135 RepID=A0A8C9MEA6_SERCA
PRASPRLQPRAGRASRPLSRLTAPALCPHQARAAAARHCPRAVWRSFNSGVGGRMEPLRVRGFLEERGRRGRPVGNPCPICRDRNLLVDFRNVKLLDQFICPHSGVIFHPIHTGICMKQHRRLSQAIAQAQDHGLLWLQVPFVPVPEEDFSNQHAAVGKTPPAPALRGPGRAWYPWYEWQQPPAAEVARMRRLYRGFLKEDYPDTPPSPETEAPGQNGGQG